MINIIIPIKWDENSYNDIIARKGTGVLACKRNDEWRPIYARVHVAAANY